MPNNLTEKWLPGTLLEDEEYEAKNTEQIRRDLEEVDDVFAAANVALQFGGAVGGIGVDANNIDGQQNDNLEGNLQPEEEWLNTSSDEENKDEDINRIQDFDLSQDISIQQMKF